MADARLVSLSELEHHLQGAGDSPFYGSTGLTVQRGDVVIDISWVADPGVVHFVAGLPVEISDEERPRVAEEVCRINAELALGSFQLRRGIAFVAYALLDERGGISSGVVDRCIALCVGAVETHGPALERLE